MTQCRVIHALMVREVIALYGRSGLGALWLAIEPLTFALPVLTLWSIVRAPFEHGIPLMPLLWSGYMPLLLFRHVGQRMLFFIRGNTGLLFHRNVTLLDIALARCLVEIIQNITAATILYGLFYIAGAIEAPRDPPMLLAGYLFMAWWSVALGLIIGAMCERSEWIEKAWQPISYTYIFFGGTWYLADWLPPGLRTIALLQPSAQSYEMIRAGVLGSRVVTHYDIGYTIFALGVLTFAGLLALRRGRQLVAIS
ncbi:MAG TPA: ABC transporter permease [Rhizomicrobium sp.]|nr:ABC transporter permease [Rhizomicrobium sp.]